MKHSETVLDHLGSVVAEREAAQARSADLEAQIVKLAALVNGQPEVRQGGLLTDILTAYVRRLQRELAEARGEAPANRIPDASPLWGAAAGTTNGAAN